MAVTQLQAEVADAADRAGAHSGAPTLLLQLQAALGRLAGLADEATEGGRRPYRVPSGWPDALGEVAYRLYLLGDQTGVEVDDAVRRVLSGTARGSHYGADVAEPRRDWI
jgi:hypothetical protein